LLRSQGAGKSRSKLSPAPLGGPILAAMTRAHRDAHWSGVPSLSQLWLAALLRLAAMLVSSVAAQVRMIVSVLSGECHTEVDPAGLPEPKHDLIKGTQLAEPNSQTMS